MKAFLVDVSICNGCYNCQIACKDEHCSNDWMPYAAPQPETGQFWLKLNEHIHGTVPKVKMHYVPVMCQHCDEAPCMAAAPEAIYRRADGMVVIDPEKAKGMKDIPASCPWGVIYYNEELDLPQKCTGCAHLLDRGWKEPRCVDACPTAALKFGEESELDLTGYSLLRPELGGSPRVYYKGIPQNFIAGTLYDSVKQEIIEGASLTLSGSDGKTTTTTTNGWGDFWFEGLEGGAYSLDIQASGYQNKTLGSIDARESVNLGDIPLD
jgi:Fe-S-cluster-containing dehydrogenase component